MSARPTLHNSLPGSQPQWTETARRVAPGLLIGILSLAATLFFGLVEIPQLDLKFDRYAGSIYVEDSDFIVKSLDPPTVKDLKLDNSVTIDLLKTYLKVRLSSDPEEHDSIDENFKQIRRREAQNPSPQTLSHLLTLHGETNLLRGDLTAAVSLLEEALQQWPENPFAVIRLVRAYEALLAPYEEKNSSWDEKEQQEVRRLMSRIRELREEYDFLSIERISALGLLGIPVFDSFNPGTFTFHDESRPEPLVAFGSLVDVVGSEPVCVGVGCDDPPSGPTQGRLVAIIIGIDGTKPWKTGGSPERLRHATADAQGTAELLRKLGFNTVVELTNQEATRERIIRVLLAEVGFSRERDRLLLYYSGHGFADAASNMGLAIPGAPDVDCDAGGVFDRPGNCTTDADDTMTIRTAGDILAVAELEAVLSHYRGRSLVFLDACREQRDVTLDVTALHNLAGPNPPTILAATGQGQIAVESERLGGGVFTSALHVYLATLLDLDGGAANPAAFDPVAFNGIAAETARLARELHGLDQRPELIDASIAR